MSYKEKERDYFSNPRIELLNLIPKNNKNKVLLEIGSGAGDTLLYAKRNSYANIVHGIDIVEIENSNQSSQEIDKFLICNVENIDFSELGSYDVIILGDVLEHLIEPVQLINKLKKCLNKNGIIIASVPNIREYRALYKVVFQGDFRYEERGTFDKTHLRFFCKQNILELFSDNNMEIINVVPNFYWGNRKKKYINVVTFGLLEEFLTVQYYVVAGVKA